MTGDDAPPVAARLEGVRKRFGETVALDGAGLTLRAGEVHGVLGENGAGKTTLLEILAGHLRPDAGALEVDGEPVTLSGPREAWSRGIGMVHQHYTLVGRLTVLENLALGVRARRGLALPLGRLRSRAGELGRRTGLDVPLDARVESLGVGERQRVEILKVLLRDPRVLVLDEPTAVLAPPEVERLLELLEGLADEGRAVVLVAHKLDEILAVADRVTVLRNGRTVLRALRDEVDAAGLARAMVGAGSGDAVPVGVGAAATASGRDLGAARGGPADEASAAEIVARLRGARVDGEGGAPRVEDADLEVRRGEIVGIAGVEGNGQRELALVLAGRLRPDGGSREIPPDPGFIPQDRRREGLVLDFDLVENLALALHREPGLRRGPLLRWGELRRRAAAAMERFDVRAPGPGASAASLSGGNQQRVVVARELERGSDLLVAENPTRGLDVAAEEYVHGRLRGLRDRTPAPGVVLISTDLDEVLALSDRLFVMVRGRLLEVPEGERTREGVGERMLAGRP